MRMRMMTWSVAAAVLVLAQAAAAQEGAATLTIEGTSTVRSWTCEAKGFTVAPTPPRGFESAVLRGLKAVETVRLTFPVDRIDCGNGTMDDHLRKALKADANPEVTYWMSTYEIRDVDGDVTVAAEGRLRIAGTERPITLDVTVEPTPQGGIRVRGEQEIRMTEFGVRPPRLMLGTLKVGDVVRVAFDLPLRPTPAILAALQRVREQD